MPDRVSTDRSANYLADMVRRLPPPGAPVVPGSTPVVAFGDVTAARVATLGINPSAAEFTTGPHLLAGKDRRLATLESLGASNLAALTDEQVLAVVRDCATYFDRQPYRRWFDPLDRVIRAGVGATYYDGSACHLDLVQWATAPIWGRIPDRGIRLALLHDGAPHLRRQLEHEQVEVVLMNGRTVIEQVRATGLAHLEKVGELSLTNSKCSLYLGSGSGVRWAGWSANLQSSFGVSNGFKQQLSEWLANNFPSTLGRPPHE